MAINRLNHAVLYVRDADRSATFYEDVLGFRRLPDVGLPGAVFLRAEGSTNDHDLGLFSVGDAAAASPAGRSAVGLYHLAWEVDTLADLERLSKSLAAAGALVGRDRPRHDARGLRQGPRWDRVRAHLDHPGGAADRR